MGPILRYLILILICAMPAMSLAQEAKTADKAPATSRVQKRAAKKKWKEQRRAEMEHKKEVKQHHKRLQTKETRRNMRKEKRKSDKLRSNKREFFLVRWFKFKH